MLRLKDDHYRVVLHRRSAQATFWIQSTCNAAVPPLLAKVLRTMHNIECTDDNVMRFPLGSKIRQKKKSTERAIWFQTASCTAGTRAFCRASKRQARRTGARQHQQRR